MSKQLRINVKVDDSAVTKLERTLDGLKQKYKSLDIQPDMTGLSKLESKLETLSVTMKNMDLRVNTSSAITSIDKVEEKVSALRRVLNDGLKLRIDTANLTSGGKGLTTDFGNSVSKQLENSLKFNDNVDRYLERYSESMRKQIKNSWQGIFTGMDGGLTDSIGVDGYIADLSKFEKEAEARGRRIKTIANEMYDALNGKEQLKTSIDSGLLSEKEIANAESQIKRLDTSIRSMKSELKELGTSFTELGGTQAKKGLADMNENIRQTMKSASETNKVMGQLDSIAKQKEQALKKMSNMRLGSEEYDAINKNISNLNSRERALMNTDDYKNASKGQRELYEANRKNYSLQQSAYNRQKQAHDLDVQNLAVKKEQDKIQTRINNENYNAQKASDKQYWKDSENSLKDYYKTVEQIDNMQAIKNTAKDTKVWTAQNEDNLQSLYKQRDALKQIKDTSLQFAKENTRNLEAHNTSYNNLANRLEQNAKLNKDLSQGRARDYVTAKAYDELVASTKRQGAYERKALTSGKNEASVYRDLIAQEEKYQQEIRQTNNLIENRNQAREEELSTIRQANRLENDNFAQLNQARMADKAMSKNQRSFFDTKFGMDGVVATFDVLDVIREGYQIARNAFDGFAELDAGLINVKKVVDATDKQFQGFTNTIYDNASAVGKTATEYATSVERWATAGFSLEESQARAKQSSIGSFVGNIDEADMVNYLAVPEIAYKGYVEVDDILNSMNEVANKNAIEMNDLGAAYQRAASTAALSGTSFQELTAMVTAAQEATRLGGEKIGSSMKAMDMNFGKMFSGVTATDRKRKSFFEDIGVEIEDSNGELRSTYEILKDLSGVWDNLSSSDQQQATFYAAGKHYGNIITSLMRDWGKVEEVKNMALGQMGLGKEGSAYQEFAIQSDSIQFKLAELKNTWQDFLSTLAGGSGIDFSKNILDGLIKLTDTAKKLVSDKQLMSGVATFAKGLGALLAVDLGKAVLRRPAQYLTGIFDAFKNIGANGGGFKGLVAGLGGIGGTAALAVDALIILNSAIEAITGKSLVGWGREVFDSFAMDAERFKTSISNLKSEMSNNKLMNGSLVDASNTLAEIQKIAEAKESLYSQTGDKKILRYSEDEFTQISTDFNNMIETLELSHDLKITWNNHDHIMKQIESARKALKDLAIEEGRLAMEALGETLNNMPDYANRFNGLSSLFDGIGGMLSKKDLENTDVMYQAEAKKLTGNNMIKALYGDTSKEMKNQLRNDFSEIDKFATQFTTNMGNLFGASKTEISNTLSSMFTGMDKEVGQHAMVQTLKTVSNYQDQVKGLSSAQSDLNTIINKGFDPKKHASLVDEFISANNEVIGSHSELQAIFSGKDGASLSSEDLKQAVQIMGELGIKATNVADGMRTGFKNVAHEFELTQQQVDSLIDSYSKGALDYVKTLREIGNAGLSAKELLGASAANVVGISAEINWDWQKGYEDALTQINSKMERQEVTQDVLVSMNILNEDGFLNGKVMEDMLALDAIQLSQNIDLGFNLEDPDAINKFLDTVTISDETKEILVKANPKISVDENGMLNLESLTQVLEDTTVEEDVKVKINEALLADKAGFKQAVEQQVKNASPDNVEATTKIKIKAEASDIDKNIISNKLKEIATGGDFVDIAKKFNIKPEINTELTEQQIANSIMTISETMSNDAQIELAAKLGLSSVEEIDFGAIQNYIQNASSEEVVDLLMQVSQIFEPSTVQQQATATIQDVVASIEGQELNAELSGEVAVDIAPIGLEHLATKFEDGLQPLKDIMSEYETSFGEVGIDIKAEVSGIEDVSEAQDLISQLPPETQIRLIAEALGLENLDAYEEFKNNPTTTVQALIEYLQANEPPTFEDTESSHEVSVNVNGEEDIVAVEEATNAIPTEQDKTTNIIFNVQDISTLSEMGDIDITITINLQDNATTGIAAVNASLDTLVARSNIVTIDANTDLYQGKVAVVKNDTIADKIVRITADTSAYNAAIDNLKTRSVTISVTASVSRKNASVGIGFGADMGKAFSASIGSVVSGKAFSNGINKAYSTSSKSDARVNEDVWRYWAKEFDGEKLSNKLDEVKESISRTGEDYKQTISLSKQQINLTREQMAYEREMNSLRQQEMSEVISKLQGYGFKANGNTITNLSHAKSLSGDRASDADKLLSTYKSLYNDMNGLGSRMAKLESTIFDLEKDIEKAKVDEEMARLERRLAQTESVITRLSNHMEILANKDSFVGNEDYELKIAVSEENISSASQNISRLLAEFNHLSTTYVQFAENSEKVYDTLEDLADEIIDNADKIIEFREQINQVRIDALIDDFDRFTDAVQKNSNILSENVSLLREGLVDGLGTSELSSFFDVDFTRKNSIQAQYQQRLQLEKDLYDALERYNKQNILRVAHYANQELQVAKDKQSELLKIQNNYGGGFLNPNSYSIGITGVNAQYSEMSKWQSRLLQSMTIYQSQYNDSIEQYEKATRSAISTTERQVAQRDMILKQLEIQESYQRNAITIYKEGIAFAQEQLRNDQLTTEQRRELLDMIDSYKENITSAQEAIRDAVSERFNYEFDLMDKASTKAQKYYDNIKHLLDVGNLTNMSASQMKPFHEALYQASIYQYSIARKQLAELNKEQARFNNGSYEWNLLGDKIEEVSESVKELGVNALNANKSILENTLNSLQDRLEKGLLNDKTLDQWNDYYDTWIDGVEKELKLENLRQKSLNTEDAIIKKRLEALDRQEAVSAKDLEYMEKQLSVLELQQKLKNITGERNQQVLTRREDGTWAFDYVADQTEYDKTKKELNDAEIDLEAYRRKQRGEYVSSLGAIIANARDGKYKNPDELRNDLDRLNRAYGTVLNDIPGFEGMSLDEIVGAYSEYMQQNGIIASDLMSPTSELTSGLTTTGATTIDANLLTATNELSKIIGSELRSALGLAEGQSLTTSTTIYKIGELVLPNVTDGDGLVNLFNTLPDMAEQKALDKESSRV